MHDVTAARQIARTVLQAAEQEGAGRVEKVRIVLGAMQMIDPEQLEFWLGQILRGSVGEGAEIEIRRNPLTVRCRACGWEGELEVPDDPIYHLMPWIPVCPACDAEELQVLGGDELTVESIRVREAEGAGEDA